MAGELTAKQKAFIAEYLSNGRNGSAAYRVAYDASGMLDKTRRACASKLLKHASVAAAIASAEAKIANPIDKAIETRQKVAQRQEVTIESLTEMAKEAFAKAQADDKGAAAMVSAIQLMGKLHGLIIEKKESKNHNINETADTLSDHELANIARTSSAVVAGSARGEKESDPLH